MLSRNLDILSDFKQYCDGKEKECSRLAISTDCYHQKVELPEDIHPFMIIEKSLEGNPILLNLGRAKDLDEKKEERDSFVFMNLGFPWLGICKVGGTVAVSANGDVRTTVDYEYTSSSGVIGNLNRNSLDEIIQSQYEKQKDREYFWKHEGY